MFFIPKTIGKFLGHCLSYIDRTDVTTREIANLAGLGNLRTFSSGISKEFRSGKASYLAHYNRALEIAQPNTPYIKLIEDTTDESGITKYSSRFPSALVSRLFYEKRVYTSLSDICQAHVEELPATTKPYVRGHTKRFVEDIIDRAVVGGKSIIFTGHLWNRIAQHYGADSTDPGRLYQQQTKALSRAFENMKLPDQTPMFTKHESSHESVRQFAVWTLNAIPLEQQVFTHFLPTLWLEQFRDVFPAECFELLSLPSPVRTAFPSAQVLDANDPVYKIIPQAQDSAADVQASIFEQELATGPSLFEDYNPPFNFDDDLENIFMSPEICLELAKELTVIEFPAPSSPPLPQQIDPDSLAPLNMQPYEATVSEPRTRHVCFTDEPMKLDFGKFGETVVTPTKEFPAQQVGVNSTDPSHLYGWYLANPDQIPKFEHKKKAAFDKLSVYDKRRYLKMRSNAAMLASLNANNESLDSTSDSESSEEFETFRNSYNTRNKRSHTETEQPEAKRRCEHED